MSTACPCGLTYDVVLDLDRRDRVPLSGGKCQNPRADGTGGFCGLALGAHPREQPQPQELMGSIEDLLARAGIISIDKKALDRMSYKFTNQVLLALRTNNSNLAKHVYEMAELLPGTQTAERLKTQSDIIVDGSLYGDSNQFIQICFNKGIPSVLKTVTLKEYEGMIALDRAMIKHPNIISWILPPKDSSAKPDKLFVVMPLMPVTMENLYGIPEEMAEKMFLQIGSALTYLHGRGFIHI